MKPVARYAVQVDHLVPDQVHALVTRIKGEQDGLHVLVNDIWGVTTMEWNKSVWESSLDIGLRTLRLGVTRTLSPVTSQYHCSKTPGGLIVEVTDGTNDNATNYRVSFFYDLAKASVSEWHSRWRTNCSHTALRRCLSLLVGYGQSLCSMSSASAKRIGVRRLHACRFAISESPAFIGRAVTALAQDPNVSRWNGKSLSSGRLAKIYGFTDIDGSKPDAWRSLLKFRMQANLPT